MNRACSQLAVLASVVALAAQAAFSYKISTDFNGAPTGTYARNDFKNALSGSSESWDNGFAEGRVTIVPGGASGNALAVKYPSGAVGPSAGGAQLLVNVLANTELSLEYKLKFPADFDWVKGGKLPGLAGAEANSGMEKPDGTDGWSARYMWRENGAAFLYVYHMDQPDDYGEYIPLNKLFQKGQWHTIKQTVTMNTVGMSDGKIVVEFDGQQVANITNLRFRTTENIKIDKFFFSTFFGGSTSDWEPSKDETILYDDIVIDDSGSDPTQALDGALFDNFEDGNNRSMWNTIWYDFTDSSAGGSSTVQMTTTAGYNSATAMGITASLDKGSYALDPYVAIGAYLKDDKTAMDISNSNGISFYYKGGGAGWNEVVLRIETPAVAESPKSPYHRINLPAAAQWTPINVTWDQFVQPSWSGITPMALDLKEVIKISFQVKGNRTATSAQAVELWLDDVKFPGLEAMTGTINRKAAGQAPVRFSFTETEDRLIFTAGEAISSTPGVIIYDLKGSCLANIAKHFFIESRNSISIDKKSLALPRGFYLLGVESQARMIRSPFTIVR